MTRAFTVGAIALSFALSLGCKKKEEDKTNKQGASTPAPATGAKATPAQPEAPKTTTTHPARTKAPLKTARGFLIHNKASAPVETLEVLDFYEKTFKFVPNLAGVMAESPVLLKTYYQLQIDLQQNGALTPPEDNIVQMSIAMENECQYCVAGHTMAGKVFFKSPDEQLEAIRKKSQLPEAKFNALRDFALQVYEGKGRVSNDQLKAFLDAGYTRKQALDVVANVAAKVMSNFTNQLAETPMDEPIKPLAKGLPFAEDRAAVKN